MHHERGKIDNPIRKGKYTEAESTVLQVFSLACGTYLGAPRRGAPGQGRGSVRGHWHSTRMAWPWPAAAYRFLQYLDGLPVLRRLFCCLIFRMISGKIK
jgi:hypothetical protein